MGLQRQVKEEQNAIASITATFGEKSSSDAQDRVLEQLKKRVKDVYIVSRFGSGDADHDPEMLKMLQEIEATLETLLAEMDELNDTNGDLVQKLEIGKDRGRREKVKEQRRKDLIKRNEDRLKQSLERSQAPVKKKFGKKIMKRSEKPQQKRIEIDNSAERAMAEDHRLFGVHFGADGKPKATEPFVPEAN